MQNVPGSHLHYSESGLIFNGQPLYNDSRRPTSTALTGNGAFAGLADYGTRLKAVFNNVPSGVNIFVSTTNVSRRRPPPYGARWPSSTNVLRSLIVSSTASETVLNHGSDAVGHWQQRRRAYVAMRRTAVNSTVTAIWEVINSNTSANQKLQLRRVPAATARTQPTTRRLPAPSPSA